MGPAEAGQLSWVEDADSAGQLSVPGLDVGSLSPVSGVPGAISKGDTLPAGDEEAS
jgi:hypothetical protein